MDIIIGSARIDERGKLKGGSAGDQKQISNTYDCKGEVSMQLLYTHKKGWYVYRAKSPEIANKLAERMKSACNNPNIGYDQNQRNGIWSVGIDTKTKTECDCSSLVRQCIKEASGIDVGNFRTVDEPKYLDKSGLFEPKISYTSSTRIYTGDILVTKTSGHTAICVSGYSRNGNTIVEVAKPVLKKGSKGNEVKKLQTCLNIFGYDLDTDGSFGTKTETALKSWQKSNGLAVDGSYGNKSYAKMVQLLSQ